MRRPLLFILLPMLLLLGGCAVGNFFNRTVDTSAAEAKAAQIDQVLANLKGSIAGWQEKIGELQQSIANQDTRLAEARAAAEQSKSTAALAVVKTLEQLKSTTESSLVQVQDLLAKGEKALPEVQAVATQVHAQLDDLKNQGETVPLWMMLGTLVLPFVPKLTSLIPLVGPAMAPVVGPIAEAAWKSLASRQQKAADADMAAKAAALPHQVEVTNSLAKVAGKDAEPVLKTAKAKQIVAGVHDTLRPLVAALEQKA